MKLSPSSSSSALGRKGRRQSNYNPQGLFSLAALPPPSQSFDPPPSSILGASTTAPQLKQSALSDPSLFYEDGMFYISFSATAGGHYRMPVSEKKIQQAVDKFTKVARVPDLPTVTAGEIGSFVIPKAKPTETCPQGEQILVTVTTPSGQEADSHVEDNGDGTATVQYRSTEAGRCSVTVRRYLTEEFKASVGPEMASPERSVFSGDEMRECYASKKATFFIQAKDRFGNDVTTGGLPFAAILTDQNGCTMHADVLDNNNGTYAVSYMPGPPGTRYNVEVGCGNQRIGGFTTSVGRPPTAVHTTALAAARPIARGEGYVEALADAPMTFMVESNDLLLKGANKFEVTLTDTDGQQVQGKVTPSGDGKFAVTYRPTRRGRYSIAVSSNNVPIAWQSARTDTSATTSTPLIATGKGIVVSAGPGIPCTFDFQSNDPALRSGLPITAHLTSVDGRCSATGVVQHVGGNKYSVLYTTPTGGEYYIDLYAGEKMISWVPAEEQAASKAKTSSIFATGKGVVQAYAGGQNEILIFSSDAHNSGSPLECTLTGPDGTTVRGQVNKDGTGMYSISFAVPVDGVYSVSLSCGGTAVSWTPIDQQWVDAARANSFAPIYAVGQGVVECVGAAPTTFVVSSHDVGLRPGEVFDVMFTDQYGDATRGSVVPLGNGRYQVSCITPSSGAYSVSLTSHNNPISWTSVTNPRMPGGVALPTCVSGQGIVSCTAGVRCVTVIRSTNCSEGLEVMVRGGGNNFGADVRLCGEDTFMIAFSPASSGPHTLTLRSAGAPIVWAPAITPLLQSITNAQRVDMVASGPGRFSATAGEMVNLVVFSGDEMIGPNDVFEAMVMGQDGSRTTPIVLQNGEGRFAVSFKAPATCAYELQIAMNGRPIVWSPVNSVTAVPVNAALTTGLSTAVAASCEGFVDAPEGSATAYVHVHDSRVASGRVFSAFLLSPDGLVRVPANVSQGSGCLFALHFVVPRSGKYEVRMMFGDQPVVWTPVASESSLVILPRGQGVVESVAGSATTFIVESHDSALKPGDVFYATVTGSDGQQMGAQVLPNGEGKYAVTFLAPSTGLFFIDMTCADVPITWSPVNVRAIAEAHAVSSNTELRVFGEGAVQATAGTPSNFTVYSTDPLLANGELFEASLLGTDGSRCVGEVKQLGVGKYEVTYTPDSSGRFAVKLSKNGRPVIWSPFPVDGCEAGNRDSISGGVRKLSITNTQGSIPHLTTALFVENPMASSLQKSEDEFRPRRRRSSVFKASSQDAKGTGLVEATGGQPSMFLVTCTDEALKNAPLRAVLTGQDGQIVEGKVSDNGDGEYGITYTVPKSGAYAIALTAGDVPVVWRPVTVTSNTKAELLAKQEAARIKTHDAVVDEPASFVIQSHDASGVPFQTGGITTFRAQLVCPSGREQQCSVRDNQDGTYAITYIPTEAGNNQLRVHMGDEECCGGPVTVVVVAGAANANTCVVAGEGLILAYATKAASFGIQALDRHKNTCTIGGAQFACQVVHEGTRQQITGTIEDNGDGTYTVSYTPTMPGPHVVQLSVGGQPFQRTWRVNVGAPPDAKNIMAINVSNLEVAADEKATVFLQSHDHNGNNFKTGGISGWTVSVIGPSGRPTTGEVADENDGSYLCHFSPMESGRNLLRISVGESEIPGSPFVVNVTKGYTHFPSCTASGKGIKSAFGTELCEFVIQARGISGNPRSEGGDVFTVVMTMANRKTTDSPSPPVNLKVGDLGNGKYAVAYRVRNSGMYRLDVTGGDHIHISESPFMVSIAPAADANEVNKVFKKYDISGDGTISEEEFALMLDDLHVDLSFKQKLDMYNKADPNGSGGIDLQEFKEFWKTFYSQLPRKRVGKKKLEYAGIEWTDEDARVTLDAFKKYDRDCDDVINPFEFRRMLDELGLLLRTQDILDLYHSINMHKCQLGITYQDFETWWIGFKERPSVSSLEGDVKEVQWSDVLEISLRKSFDKYDPSGDGTISFLEFGMLMEDLEIKTTTSALMGLYESVDDNANGSISYEEFRNWWMVFQVTKGRYGL